MLFIMCLLAAVGLSHLIVDASVFARFRGYVVEHCKTWIIELISCYQCSGFWTGVFMGLILQPLAWNLESLHLFFMTPCSVFMFILWCLIFVPTWLILHMLVTPLVVGCASSYLSMGAAALLNWLDAPAISAKKQEGKNQ